MCATCKKVKSALAKLAGKGTFNRPCQHWGVCGCQKISVYAANGSKIGATVPHKKYIGSVVNNSKAGYTYCVTMAQFKTACQRASKRG